MSYLILYILVSSPLTFDLTFFSLKRPETVGTQFRSSLNKLMDILMSKDPSYVRCIKPNDVKMAGLCVNFIILLFHS